MSDTSLKEKQKILRENSILDAAQELISLHGYEAVTMDDLAAHVGISKPTLYQHFPSKELIAAQAVVRHINEVVELIHSLSKDTSAWERIQGVFRSSLQRKFIQCRPFYGTGHAAIRPIIQNNPEYLAARRTITQCLENLINEAKHEGSVRPEIATSVIVQMYLCPMRDPDFFLLVETNECTGAELVEALLSLMQHGIQAHAPSQ